VLAVRDTWILAKSCMYVLEAILGRNSLCGYIRIGRDKITALAASHSLTAAISLDSRPWQLS